MTRLPAFLGSRVHIRGASIIGTWKRWDSLTDDAIVIDDDGVIHQTKYAHLEGVLQTMFQINDSVIRRGDMETGVNVGRVVEVQLGGKVVVAHMPAGHLRALPSTDWKHSRLDSSVKATVTGERVESVGPWQGGEPVVETLTTEEKNIREVARVANLRADGDQVETRADPDEAAIPVSDEDHDPAWQLEPVDVFEDPIADAMATWQPKAVAALADLSADPGDMVEDLPSGEPQTDDVRDRVMNADHTAPAPKTTEAAALTKKPDDITDIIDTLRKRIAQLESDHEDALKLIAALPLRSADTRPAVQTQTLFQTDVNDVTRRAAADAELALLLNTGWRVVSEETHVHPFVRVELGERIDETTATRIIRLEKPLSSATPGARATAAAAAPNGTHRTTTQRIQQPVVIIDEPQSELSPVSRLLGRDPIVRRPLHELRRDLDVEAMQAGMDAVAAYRAANPPIIPQRLGMLSAGQPS